MTRKNHRWTRVVVPLLTLPTAALAPLALPAAAHADNAGSIGDVQNLLSGCSGTLDSPTVITVTADISSPSTALTVPCAVQLLLSGHDLSVASIKVTTGDTLLVGDPTLASDAGVLSARGTGSASGITVTLSRLIVDSGTVTATDISAENHGRLDVSGGTVVASNTSATGDSGVDLGDSGVLSVSDGGTLTGRGGPARAGGVVVGASGSILLAGGQLTGVGASGGPGVGVGNNGVVSVVDGDMSATGGSQQAGVNIPGSGRLTVSGGTIEAQGGASGAGIGGAQGGTTGLIQVIGGAVTAAGGASASGVGNGQGGTSGPLVVLDGSLTTSAPSDGTAIGIDATSGPAKIEGGVLRLPGGPIVLSNTVSGAELGIGPRAVLDGSDPASGPRTFATFTGNGDVKNSGVIKIPVGVVTANGIGIIGNYRTVSFDTQGGSPASIPSSTVLAPSFATGGVVFPANPTMQYHTFLGWFTQPDGSGTAIAATSKLPGGSTSGQPFQLTAYARFQYLPPSLSATITSKPPASAGWYRGAVRIAFTCRQGTLRITTPCPKAVVIGKQTAGATVTRRISDTRGRVVTKTVTGIRIDITRPTLQVTGVKPGATYGHVQKVGCRVSDALSGPGRCKVTTHRKKHTVVYRLVGVDVAGNARTLTGFYRLS